MAVCFVHCFVISAESDKFIECHVSTVFVKERYSASSGLCIDLLQEFSSDRTGGKGAVMICTGLSGLLSCLCNAIVSNQLCAVRSWR